MVSYLKPCCVFLKDTSSTTPLWPEVSTVNECLFYLLIIVVNGSVDILWPSQHSTPPVPISGLLALTAIEMMDSY